MMQTLTGSDSVNRVLVSEAVAKECAWGKLEHDLNG